MKTHCITEMPCPARPAYLANGLVGLRVNALPFTRGTALVNGFIGLSPEKAGDELAEAIYPVGADIAINGVWLSQRPDCLKFIEQAYDFSCGELRSTFEFSACGVTARVDTFLCCVRSSPTLTIQETSVTVDKPCALTLQAHLDPRGLMGRLLRQYRSGRDASRRDGDSDGVVLWEARGGLSTLGASYVGDYLGEGLKSRSRNNYCHEEDFFLTDFHIDAAPGRKHVMRQMGSLVPGAMHSEPHWQAHRFVTYARHLTFDRLREDNRAAWAELWRGRPKLVGAESRWQDMADAAYFYLHSSIHRSSPASIAPFGLSHRTAYSGHFFWDAESFMFPAVLLTAPASARAMLDYRSRMLQAARDNARLNGYEGIQFPWQSSLTGSEVSPFYSGAGAGLAEQHIVLDVAFAFLQYAQASGDDLFLKQQAWPVLEGTAQWICSRLRKTSRGYEIHNITGVDESIDNINNHGMTNGLSKLLLREASQMAGRLGFAPPARWGEVAERIFLPINAATGALEKHEGAEHHLTHASPDTLMLQVFPFGYVFDSKVAEASLKHQVSLGHTYMGMPMNAANFAVWASRLGDRKLSLEFFEKGTAARFREPYFQFVESVNSAFPGSGESTSFITGMGAFMTACIMGLTGLKLDDGDPRSWAKHKISLPEGWDAIEIESIHAQGKTYSLRAKQGAAAATLE